MTNIFYTFNKSLQSLLLLENENAAYIDNNGQDIFT